MSEHSRDASPEQAPSQGVTRRELFQMGNALALPMLFGSAASLTATAAAGPLVAGPEIYQSIGVEPVINCRGTFTIIGGSVELPEVRAAMDHAARHFVQIDELAEAVGRRFAEITGAEWGMVSAGCAAGMKHVTVACVTGGNPEKLVRIPDLTGLDKTEVVVPRSSRNVYDHAIRNVGVKMVTVETIEELENALNPRTAMIYLLADNGPGSGPMALEAIARIAKPRNIPILVDAAAEILTIPNVHLQRGATVVAYSGGKAICGPQCAGLLLGRKDILQSAWQASAPHHGPGRDNKVGREETLGMLAAVEAWVKRDHAAEWKTWLSWLDTISTRVSTIDGVRTTLREPTDLSNKSPSLSILWDASKLHVTGEELAEELARTKPRIAVGAGSGGNRGGAPLPPGTTGVTVTAWQMQRGEDKIVADRLHEALSRSASAAAGRDARSGRESQRALGRRRRVLQQPQPAHPLHRAGWQLDSRLAQGGLHRSRHGRHDRRGQGDAAERRATAGRLRHLHLLGHARRWCALRTDPPRRVPDREVHGQAPHLLDHTHPDHGSRRTAHRHIAACDARPRFDDPTRQRPTRDRTGRAGVRCVTEGGQQAASTLRELIANLRGLDLDPVSCTVTGLESGRPDPHVEPCLEELFSCRYLIVVRKRGFDRPSPTGSPLVPRQLTSLGTSAGSCLHSDDLSPRVVRSPLAIWLAAPPSYPAQYQRRGVGY